MERADELLGIAGALGEQGAAVGADIVKGAHLAIRAAHHQDGIVDDVIDNVVARIGDLVLAGGDLPDLGPELFLLQFVERAVQGIFLGDIVVANRIGRVF